MQQYLESAETIKSLVRLADGGTQGRVRKGVSAALYKMLILYYCQSFEQYLVSVVKSAAEFIGDGFSDSVSCPDSIRRIIKKQIFGSDHKKANGALSAVLNDGWRSAYIELVASRLGDGVHRNSSAKHVETLIGGTLGLKNIAARWHWQKVSVDVAKQRFNDLFELRDSIASGSASAVDVKQRDVEAYFKFLDRVVGIMDKAIIEYCFSQGPNRGWVVSADKL